MSFDIVSTSSEEKFFNWGEDGEFQTQNISGANDIGLDIVFSTDYLETFSTISGEVRFFASNDGINFKNIGSVGSHNFGSVNVRNFYIHNNTYSFLKFDFVWFTGQGKIKITGKFRKV